MLAVNCCLCYLTYMINDFGHDIFAPNFGMRPGWRLWKCNVHCFLAGGEWAGVWESFYKVNGSIVECKWIWRATTSSSRKCPNFSYACLWSSKNQLRRGSHLRRICGRLLPLSLLCSYGAARWGFPRPTYHTSTKRTVCSLHNGTFWIHFCSLKSAILQLKNWVDFKGLFFDFAIPHCFGTVILGSERERLGSIGRQTWQPHKGRILKKKALLEALQAFLLKPRESYLKIMF